MYDNEDDEPTMTDDSELERNASRSRTVSIVGLTAEDIEAVIKGSVANEIGASTIREEVRRLMTAAVHDRVGAMIAEFAHDVIEQEVARICAEGWDETDSWGKLKKHHTIQDMVLGYLQSKPDNYSNSKPRIDTIIGKHVEVAIDKDLTATLVKARALLKEQVDQLFNIKVREVIAQALGIK